MSHEVRLAQPEAAITGESPVWDENRGVLWWVDIQGRRLLGWRPAEAMAVPAFALPQEIGLVAIGSDGSLVLGLEDGLYRHVPETGALDLLTPVPHGVPNLRLNDGKPDRQGRLWFGSMDKSGSGLPVGALYCRDLDGSLRSVRRDVRIPNAIAVSPEGGTLYFSDSPSKQVLAFDLDQTTGELRNERVFATYAGEDKPDGSAVDADGNLWVAVVHGARIDQLSSTGELRMSIPVPVQKPTMPAFGGPGRRTIFVTSQRRFLSDEQLSAHPLTGALLAVDVDVAGMRGYTVKL